MYRPRAFAMDDVAVLRGFVVERGFATLALSDLDSGHIHFAYAPIVLDGSGLGRLRFHLARVNPFCALADGAELAVSVMGDDVYISPDWYAQPELVPTWNYMAVEGRGVARKLSPALLDELLVDLSAEREARLTPKSPWLISKVSEHRLDFMRQAIEGFELELRVLQGKFKLSQDKTEADCLGVIAALEAHGDARSLAVAKAMRNVLNISDIVTQ